MRPKPENCQGDFSWFLYISIVRNGHNQYSAKSIHLVHNARRYRTDLERQRKIRSALTLLQCAYSPQS